MSPRILLGTCLALILSLAFTATAQPVRTAPMDMDFRKHIATLEKMRVEVAAMCAEMRGLRQGQKPAPKAVKDDPDPRRTDAPARLEDLGRAVSTLRKAWGGLRDEMHVLLRALRPDRKRIAEIQRKLIALQIDRTSLMAPMPGKDASPELLREQLRLTRQVCELQRQMLLEQEKRMRLLQLISRSPFRVDPKQPASEDRTLQEILKRAVDKYKKLAKRVADEETKRDKEKKEEEEKKKKPDGK